MGVDHEVQRSDKTGDLAKLLRRQIDSESVSLVAEEAIEDDSTVAQRIAADRSVQWLGVDATTCEKTELGIVDELASRPTPLILEGDFCVGMKSRYLPNADGIREELWIQKILANEIDTALMVCGLLHMRSLAEKFTARGCNVAQINVCATDWYRAQYGEVTMLRDCKGNTWCECRYKTPVSIYPR